MVPPLGRLPQAIGLVEAQKYFVVHAPRQSGKTTTIHALAQELTASGQYAALAFSCESARSAGDDYQAAESRILSEIRADADAFLPSELRPPEWPQPDNGTPLADGLGAWARACPRPLVLFFDEIDSLAGNSLISVLSQLRAGYRRSPEAFPWSVVLCGMRNVRDYKIASGGDPARLGTSSPFNIAVDALRIGDFTPDEVTRLYGQHTTDTGQVFTAEGIDYAYELTQGQPWLVNALAREVIEKMGVPVTEDIGPRRLETAKERLIRARATHLDSLVDKLAEDRVRRILQPLITGVDDIDPTADETYDDDVTYVRDLGLVAPDLPLRVANPVYREVIPRVLGARSESRITADPRAFIRDDGTLDFDKLLTEFVAFWKEHGEVLTRRDSYHEAAPQLVLMAFLHRIVNGGVGGGSGIGGGEQRVDREYGVGRGRIDIQIRWPYEQNNRRTWQREALEIRSGDQANPTPSPTGSGNSTTTSTGSALTTGPWSSSTVAQRPLRSPNAPNSPPTKPPPAGPSH